MFTAVAVQAANIHVGASATGNGSGADWNNQAAWSSLSFTRGNVYYLATGSYGGKTLSTATSGTTLITIKKATVADHGSSTGWIDTMGGQTIFTGSFNITTSYWTVDGQTGGGPGSWKTGFGFKFGPMAQDEAFINSDSSNAVSNITMKHVEMAGTGSTTINTFPHYNGFCFFYKGSNLLISYVYVHDVGDNAFDFRQGNNITVEYAYTGIYGTNPNHAECYWINPNQAQQHPNPLMTNITVRYSVMSYVANSTGGLLMGDVNGVYIYGNLFFRPDGQTWTYNNNGVVSQWSCYDALNVLIYNNTFYNLSSGLCVNFPANNGCSGFTSDVHAYNNIFSGSPPSFGGVPAHDYNSTTGTESVINSEAHGATNATLNFVSTGNANFHLTSNTAAGLNLGSPYNTDPDGVTRATWTRGTYEFGTTISTPTPAPSATGTPAPTATPTSTATATPTSTPASTPTGTPVPGGSPIEAESGTISAPFTISGGSISQNVTTGISGSGRAAYSITIADTADYVIQAFANGSSVASNSFYLNIDAEPQDPAMIWDIYPPTAGFENRLVSWRGSGAEESDEFQPKTFHLTAGIHQVIIRGREANAQLDRFTILKVPSAPSNLQVLPP